jgi:thiamine biosynthesis lipoprotein
VNATPPLRRARPLLGTLVEVGCGDVAQANAAFDAVERVQRLMSRFDAGSDLGRFQALGAGESLVVDPWTAEVLRAAGELQRASGGLFDVTLGSAPAGWALDGNRLHKLTADVRLDLGGIAKGYAVDRAVEALQVAGGTAGWVNAGGDLRVFGELDLPIRLRDERSGGVREFGTLRDGALATSHLAPYARSRHSVPHVDAHVSVIAPECLWADALTKLVAAGQCPPELLAAHDAHACLH